MKDGNSLSMCAIPRRVIVCSLLMVTALGVKDTQGERFLERGI